MAVDAVTGEPVSGAKFPITGKITGNFGYLSKPDRAYPLVNTGERAFRPEIGTGNEQGTNRRDNRENMSRNRLLITLPDASREADSLRGMAIATIIDEMWWQTGPRVIRIVIGILDLEIANH
jgi:hypothetical protein